jgi:asparagine synthase (glutamine-hydrolysing)
MLKQRRIVRAALIDELMTTYVDDHAAYYGTMAWVLMMLEQWFQQHASGKPFGVST